MFRKLLVFGFILTLVAAGAAEAQLWTTAGAACSLSTATGHKLANNGGRITFKNGQHGTAEVICNITNPMDDGSNPGWVAWEMLYRDPDGSVNATEVKSVLYSQNMFGGINQLKAASSNTNPDMGNTSVVSSFNTNLIDFSTNTYYFSVTLKRPSGGDTPRFHALRMLPASGPCFEGGQGCPTLEGEAR